MAEAHAMLVVVLCVIAAAVVSAAEESSGSGMLSKLQAAQKKINEDEDVHCYTDHSNTKNAYLKGLYDNFGLEDSQTLVYPFCLKTRELGNKLGNYFSELACADAAGLHFIAIHKQWDIDGAHTNVTAKDGTILRRNGGVKIDSHRKAFLDALPDVVVHKNPAGSAEEGKKRVADICKCTRYCWQDPLAPWVNNTAIIKKHLRVAVHAYLDTVRDLRGLICSCLEDCCSVMLLPYSISADALEILVLSSIMLYDNISIAQHHHTNYNLKSTQVQDVVKEGTTVSPDTDFSNAAQDAHLPIVPDVAIQYRCGDNIGFNYKYGLLPFFALPQRIPKDAKYIYVLSDHPSRQAQAVYSSRCQTILEALFEYLKKNFPDSTIVIKRGGDLFLDYARLTLSNVTICSASTYCLWPALAHEGVVHFPLTSLVVNADNIQLAAPMPSNFKWYVHA